MELSEEAELKAMADEDELRLWAKPLSADGGKGMSGLRDEGAPYGRGKRTQAYEEWRQNTPWAHGASWFAGYEAAVRIAEAERAKKQEAQLAALDAYGALLGTAKAALMAWASAEHKHYLTDMPNSNHCDACVALMDYCYGRND